ncbi:ATP-binding protein [Bradyrhizobium sp. SZCCHNRI1058]|uniref:ATP-binding protein n=1 Tax=Bradyrhizobium sp. SZCCHNRI1058 TaxID=3057279 RepID=UPI002915E957|nr:ATP-binding protein [Bradyrhizobium sp. SZCCHNRI1058]
MAISESIFSVPTRAVPPSAAALVGSLRGVGYSLETAIADILDNSIAAGAKSIEIQWEWNDGDTVGWILDDGIGMHADRLVEAMRFGGVGPEAERTAEDLGRFGLGLKTASLSQCRQLTVVSRTSAGVASFTWDLDELRRNGSGGGWDLIEGDAGLSDEIRHQLTSGKSGTLVVWRKVDFGRTSDRPSYEAFLADLARVDAHLGMVFHRFLAGDARALRITLNGSRVKAWDPFLENDTSVIRTPEQDIAGPGGRVRVRGFVLPHRDRFRNEIDFENAGGPDGWTAQQGFYVYRHRRLLSAGGWLGLGGSRAWTRDETSRLARIRIDIPNTADHDWRIDVRKAIARPPDAIRRPLQRIAEDVRRKAREVFVHRGQYGSRRKAAGVSRIWQVNPEGAKRRYTVQRDHEFVELIKGRTDKTGRDLLEGLLDLIERTVPVDRVWLDVTEHGVPDQQVDGSELLTAALAMARMMERAGLDSREAVARLARMDPYDKVEDLEEKLMRKLRGAKR